jgi:hypothetical protein
VTTIPNRGHASGVNWHYEPRSSRITFTAVLTGWKQFVPIRTLNPSRPIWGERNVAANKTKDDILQPFRISMVQFRNEKGCSQKNFHHIHSFWLLITALSARLSDVLCYRPKTRCWFWTCGVQHLIQSWKPRVSVKNHALFRSYIILVIYLKMCRMCVCPPYNLTYISEERSKTCAISLQARQIAFVHVGRLQS